MKIYFSGINTPLNKLLSTHGDVVSGHDWFEKSHVLIVDDEEETLIQNAQEMLKPILFLSKSGKKRVTQETAEHYPFMMVGQYKSSSEVKTVVDEFFKEYGAVAKSNNSYCCGGGCCSNV